MVRRKDSVPTGADKRAGAENSAGVGKGTGAGNGAGTESLAATDGRSKVEKLIDIMFSEAEVPEESMARMRWWLSGSENEEEKSAALYAKFIEKFKFNPEPVLAPALWPELARRLGLDETPVAASYDPLASRGSDAEMAGVVTESMSETAQETLQSWESGAQTRQKLFLRRTILRVAAVLAPVALVLGGVWWMLSRGPQSDIVAIEVPEGTTQTIDLPDGSRVEAEGGSTVSWDAKTFADNRAVALSGEALFDVAEATGNDGSRIPFTVETDDLAVNVLGTVFRLAENSGADDSRAAVSLYEGSVGVKVAAYAGEGEPEAAPAETILARGERLKVNTATGELQTELIPASEMAEHGVIPLLRFEEATLGDLIVAFELNFEVEIEVAEGVDTAAGRYSADFEGTELDDVLKMLSRIDPGLSWQTDGDVISVRKR